MNANKLTIDSIKRKLALNAIRHDKQLKAAIAQAKKSRSKYRYIPEYKPYRPAIPFRPRLQIFKTNHNHFDPVKFEAYSYDWWRYLEIRRGKVVFNNYSYSMQTNKHQWALRSLLEELGIKINVELSLPRGLQSFETDALPYLYDKIIQLEIQIANKRSKKETNDWRKRQIKYLLKDVKNARMLGAKLSQAAIKEMRDKAFAEEANRVARLEEQAKQRREISKLAKVNVGLDVSQFVSE